MMVGYTRNCHVQVFAQIILHKSCFPYVRQRFCNAQTRMESLQFTSLLDLSYLESMHLVSWMLKVPSRFHWPTLLHQLFFFKWYLLKNLNHLFGSQFCFPASELSQYGVCVCVFTSTVKASYIWNSSNIKGQINNVVLKRFLSSTKSPHCYLEWSTEPSKTSHFVLFTH